ncbi:MAG: ATP-binding protein, partial [Methylacidiphilaceae bacterium]|nr:ATP-binding protein [Candidatus Methylacidiphilaceae bacterium]
YATVGSRPTALAVLGRVGAGKTTLAAGLARELGWAHLSSDSPRKELAGLPSGGRPSEEVRSWLYSPEFSEKTYDELLRRALDALRAGSGCVVDATFSRREERRKLQEVCSQAGAELVFLEAQADDAVRRDRLQAREKQPDAISDARAENLAFLDGRFEPPTAEETLLPIPCEESPEAAVSEALHALAARKAAVS